MSQKDTKTEKSGEKGNKANVRVQVVSTRGSGEDDDRFLGDTYYFDEEDEDIEEDSLYKPAPPRDKKESESIKVEKIRRDDKGHVLPVEPVRMPKENLYYNNDGYIPQENINYAKKEREESFLDEDDGKGSDVAFFDEDDEKSDEAFFDEEDKQEEPAAEAASFDEADTKEPESIFDRMDREKAERAYKEPDPLEEAQAEDDGENNDVTDVESDRDNEKEGDAFDKYYGDSWVTKFVPPKPDGSEAKARSPLRVAGIVAAVIVLFVLAVIAGGFVALLDLEKTTDNLMSAFRGTYTAELTEEYLEALRLANKDQEEDIVVEHISEDSTEEEEEVVSEEESGEEYAESDVEIAGLRSIVDAESGDEIPFVKTASVSENEVAAVFETPDPNELYPLEPREVDYGYFLDALFIGDSRLQGFGMYADLPATYYCVTSFSVYKYDTMKVVQTDAGKVPIFDVLPYDMFTKIYIKIGLNEMGGDEELFYAKYAELIARLREYEPRAIIYVHGILPVTNAKSASDKYHNNPNIAARNEKLKAFAEEQQAYYIEVNSALALEDGSLPPEATTDGIHLKAQYMEPWKEYLRTHAIVVP